MTGKEKIIEIDEEELPKMSSLALIALTNELLEKEVSIETLRKIREEMLLRRFNAPFRALMKITKNEFTENSSEELADLKKQISFFRYVAMLKKSTLARVRVAISARRLKERLPYPDFLPYLPYDGNYVGKLIRAGATGIRIFRELDELAKPYFHSTSVRKALLSAIVHYVSDGVKKEVEEKENDGELIAYNNILKKYNILSYVRIDHLEGFDRVKEELEKNGFIKEGKTRDDILKKIEERRKKIREEMKRRCYLLFFYPLFRYYMSPRTKREKSPVYPGVEKELNERIIEGFNAVKGFFGFNAVKVLKEKAKYDDYEVGGGVLAEVVGKERAKEILKIGKEEIERAIALYKSLKEGRGGEFLRHLSD